MKLRIFMTSAMLGGSLLAQIAVPSNPEKFTTRAVGGGVDTGASIAENPRTGNVRYVTHVVLFESRIWTSAEGKPLAGKLIAFEDIIAEAPKGAPVPAMTQAPARPTLIKNESIRLLVDKKAVEVPLARLSLQDREFVDGIAAALAKKAAEGR